MTFGSTSLATSGGSWGDMFVAKLSSSGSWQWAVQVGSSSGVTGWGIAIDSSGDAYVSGTFNETTFGSTSLTSSGSGDMFIAKLSSSGSWHWAVKAGSSGGDGGYDIAIDSSGDAYVSGSFIAIHQDQDMDGFNNTNDRCHDGVINWISDSSNDFDSDGCRDVDEDDDDDNDGIIDSSDSCQKGVLGWTPDLSTDYDTDGCRDVDEDDDDDNDGITDVVILVKGGPQLDIGFIDRS